MMVVAVQEVDLAVEDMKDEEAVEEDKDQAEKIAVGDKEDEIVQVAVGDKEDEPVQVAVGDKENEAVVHLPLLQDTFLVEPCWDEEEQQNHPYSI